MKHYPDQKEIKKENTMIHKEKRNHSFTKAKDGPTLIDPWSLFYFFS